MAATNNIAKNTAFLYLRMFFILGVTLYTSRIILEQLGVSDYGIYSLVGGIVAMLGFFRGAMTNATRRYLSFDLGKGDFVKLRKTFSATLTIHLVIALAVFILAESLGLWYLKNKMVFPENRLVAVHFVYQFSVLTFLVTIVQVPYDALIQAREKMKIYALVSIVEAILKLLIVYLLIYFGNDKLITFSVLTFIVAVIIRLIYQIYCRKEFEESKYHFDFDKNYFIELLSYSGWNLFGSLAVVARGQGSNIILNLFYGTNINAAYGIGTQVQTAVQLFVNNFQIAVNPQIIKTYAQGDFKQNHKLILQSSKLSFFLLFIIICPIWFNTKYILELWLKNIPDYTPAFVQLILVYILIDTISAPLMVGAQATGKIKWYQIVVGILLFLNLPISYVLLKRPNAEPNIVFELMIVISFITLLFRILFLKYMIRLNVFDFSKKVIFPILLVSALSISIIYFLMPLITLHNFFMLFVVKLLIIAVVNIGLITIFGLDIQERNFLKKILKKNYR